MAAWGITNFENDVALDFVNEMVTNGKQLSIGEYVDVFLKNFDAEQTSLDECLTLLTVAEILAAILGEPSEDLPIELKEWVERSYIQVDTKVVGKVEKAIQLLLKDSEAKEMYCDTPYYKAWKKVQDELLKRLNS